MKLSVLKKTGVYICLFVCCDFMCFFRGLFFDKTYGNLLKVGTLILLFFAKV